MSGRSQPCTPTKLLLYLCLELGSFQGPLTLRIESYGGLGKGTLTPVFTPVFAALAIQVTATEDLAKAELHVWKAVIAHSPTLETAISGLGWNEHQAARWVCHPLGQLGDIPAHLVATKKAEFVLALVFRTTHGIG